jgi:hypothetical protein
MSNTSLYLKKKFYSRTASPNIRKGYNMRMSRRGNKGHPWLKLGAIFPFDFFGFLGIFVGVGGAASYS